MEENGKDKNRNQWNNNKNKTQNQTNKTQNVREEKANKLMFKRSIKVVKLRKDTRQKTQITAIRKKKVIITIDPAGIKKT